jgi:hypothetical protein
MKVKSDKVKGQRIYSSQHKKRPYHIEPVDTDLWFNLITGEWGSLGSKAYPMSSSYYGMSVHGFKDVWSIKAAKRKINRWNIPKGTKFRVLSPYVGYDFIITK